MEVGAAAAAAGAAGLHLAGAGAQGHVRDGWKVTGCQLAHMLCVLKRSVPKRKPTVDVDVFSFCSDSPPYVPPRWACVKIVATPEWVVFPLVALETEGDRVPLKHTQRKRHTESPILRHTYKIEAC